MSKEYKAKKVLLFSLSHKDFELQFFRCPGKGGQNVQKVESGVRIKHIASGAVAESCVHRTQGQNKELAFNILCKRKEFLAWHKLECARRLLNYQSITKMIEDGVDKALNLKNLKFEVKDEQGRWTEVDDSYFEQEPYISEEEYQLIDFCNNQ